MKLNVEQFRQIVHVATANYYMTGLHLQIKPGVISSAMKSNDGFAVSKIAVPNTVLEDMKNEKEVDFYFNDIKTNLMPYIALLKGETMNIKMLENGFTLLDDKRKVKILFCDSSIVNVATKTNPNIDFNIHLTYEDVEEAYMDVKKIAPRFGKIFIGRKDNNLYLETKDGNYSNSIKAEMGQNEGIDFEVCFDFKVFNSVFTSLGDGDGFDFNMAYMKDRGAGMIFWKQSEGDFFKEYFIVSKSD
jgi:hypothetical protein